MKLDVLFREAEQCFSTEFGEVHNVSDGGFDRGFAQGYEDGKTFGESTALMLLERTIAEIESNASKIEDNALYGCKQLTSAVFPQAQLLGDNSMRDCTNLVRLEIPNATSLQGSSLRGCVKLTKVDLPKVEQLFAYVFNGCTKLDTLILRYEKLCSMSNTNALASTPIASGTGYIYVPSTLVEGYKTASSWSTYAAQIRAIEDYPDITGEGVK